ncbi:MFS transporter [Methylobacterium sp. WL30]|uniref:MFS transporter n=1 Tax=unclassified Methylobacterium TaxID=2615210 RepID=UPI0011C6F784|nr:MULTISPECIES: MFS transporter [unclassified Methylobacterium]TXN50815.1 MFS transporter [Methylobacterium sp. WL119]TXN66630.1 MFS transporter [Methylobacterium sp. WL30]
MKRDGLVGCLALYAALYGAYGCISPILPNVLAAGGLPPERIAILLAAATLVRLVAGPLAGRSADRHAATRPILAAACGLTALAVLGHLPARGFWPFLAVGLAYAVTTAPLAPLADVLGLAAARGGAAFPYGWVRGAGSAAFIAGVGAAGWLVQGFGLAAGLVAGAVLFAAAGSAALAGRDPGVARDGPVAAPGIGFADVLRLPAFRRTVLVAALVIGAHAMHDAFAMILWREAGIGAGAAGLLWAEAVAAEVFVFLIAGPPLLARIGLPGGLAVAAGAGALRWAVQAETVALPWLAAIQSLHGLSFALLHLACLGLIERTVPPAARATALALYGTVGLGLAGAAATLASGPLYSAFHGRGFWAMAVLSLAALPLVPRLRPPSEGTTSA